MRRSGKVWGETQQIEANHAFEMHRISVKKNHKCSEHYHKHKYNGFYVEEGELAVYVEKPDSGTLDRTVLQSGDYLVVSPGEIHWFVGLAEYTTAFEVYWTEGPKEDIIRRTYGE